MYGFLILFFSVGGGFGGLRILTMTTICIILKALFLAENVVLHPSALFPSVKQSDYKIFS